MTKKGRRAELRRRFRSLRVSADLSQMETAERAGISLSRYWRIENGYAEPSAEDLAVLAKVFKIQISDFDQEAVAR